jgi:hypothetical protein
MHGDIIQKPGSTSQKQIHRGRNRERARHGGEGIRNHEKFKQAGIRMRQTWIRNHDREQEEIDGEESHGFASARSPPFSASEGRRGTTKKNTEKEKRREREKREREEREKREREDSFHTWPEA